MENKEVNIIVNSIILSHALSDCLTVMVERGFLYRDLKQTAKRYEKLIERNNKEVFKNVTDERMEFISKEIDQNIEILKQLNRLDFNKKQDVLDGLTKIQD